METITGAIIALSIAVISNAGAVWYKLGRLEGKVDNMYILLNRKKQGEN